MAVSKSLIEKVFGRFQLLFDAPQAARTNMDAAADAWARVLPETMTDTQFATASGLLALELTRYPVPADVLDALRRVDHARKDQGNPQ